MQSKESLNVLIKKIRKDTKEGAKGFFFWVFLDPSSPRLASGSLGPSNNFMVKKLARLGELQPPQSGLLPINRHPRGVLRGSKFQKWKVSREERNKRKKEEETKPRRY